jgi:hypothetical protein
MPQTTMTDDEEAAYVRERDQAAMAVVLAGMNRKPGLVVENARGYDAHRGRWVGGRR